MRASIASNGASPNASLKMLVSYADAFPNGYCVDFSFLPLSFEIRVAYGFLYVCIWVMIEMRKGSIMGLICGEPIS